MSMQRCLLGMLALFVSVAATGARAQDAESEALIEEGVTLREQGRDADARERFERAYALSSSSRALAQLALAEQALGEWVKAHTHLTAALQAGGSWIDQNRAPLERALERIGEHVAHLEVVGGVDGAEVRVNGEPAGVLPLAQPLTVLAGTVVLEVTASGYVPMRRTLEMRGGGRARERITLVPASGAAALSGSADPEASMTRGATSSGPDDGLIGTAIGAYAVAGAGAVVMAIFGGLTASSHSALAEGCGATRSCTPADVAETNTFALVSDVSLGVTLAGAVVGSVLLAVGLSASGGSEQRATLTPWITPEGAGAVGQLRF